MSTALSHDDSARARPARSLLTHGLRIALLAAIVLLVHLQHERWLARRQSGTLGDDALVLVQPLMPAAARWGDAAPHGGRQLLAGDGRALGFALQTSPQGDRFLGFSGPTNLLIVFDETERVVGTAILSSLDTRDHVELITRHAAFLKSWTGRQASDAAQADVDAVAGATLTSLAIVQSLRERLGGNAGSLKFPNPLTVADAQLLFPQAAALERDASLPALWHVRGAEQRELGYILRTSPAADEIVGYQGPTEARVGIALGGDIVGVTVGESFDNEPYVGYVRSDEYFRHLFDGQSLEQLSKLDLDAAGVEGVSGATMTSMAVAQGLVRAANAHAQAQQRRQAEASAARAAWRRHIGAIAMVVAGVVIGLTSLRANKTVRRAYQLLVIVYLGFINGDLLSIAMLVGWAQSGVPWTNALGLVVMAIAAFALPVVTKHNVYCAHICPHGAVQQILPRRWRMHQVPRRLVWLLRAIRPLLLVWVLLVACGHWAFSLVDIEPFDAYAWRAAAWPTCAVAVVGLIASLFLPLGYCRYGCPTGAILAHVRRHARSDRLTWADAFAAACLGLGLAMYWLG